MYDYSYNVLSKTLEISPTQIRIYYPSGRSITLSTNKIEIRNDNGSTSFSAEMQIRDGVNEKIYLRARGLPTSSTGLLSGEMYRDSSGYIKIV